MLCFLKALNNQDKDAIRDGLADAMDVNTVIQSDFGFTPASTTIVFITAHYHLDHLNKEFIAAFFENLGYDMLKTAILVHTSDYFAATCNLKCCGSPVCDKDHYFEAPYNDPWTTTYLNLFKTVGINSFDKCNKVLKTFTSAMDNWMLLHNKNTLQGGHTDGTLNLKNKTKKLFIHGADENAQCPAPTGYTILPLHGNLVAFAPKYETDEEIPSETLRAVLFPNPCANQITLSFNQDPDHVSFGVVNILGKTVMFIQDVSNNQITISTEAFVPGMYCYQLFKDNKVMDAGIFVKE